LARTSAKQINAVDVVQEGNELRIDYSRETNGPMDSHIIIRNARHGISLSLMAPGARIISLLNPTADTRVIGDKLKELPTHIPPDIFSLHAVPEMPPEVPFARPSIRK